MRGSAVNQDGRTIGLTAPNGPAQQAVIRRALRQCRVPRRRSDYIEAHGTGTSLGDPIEVARCWPRARPGTRHDAATIGSVKTNIGHLEAAAGVRSHQGDAVAGARAVARASAFPHALASYSVEAIAVEGRVGGAPRPRAERKRRAGVSSFGFTGTNAHVILEEAPRVDAAAPGETPSSRERPWHMLPLSARSVAALKALALSYVSRVET